MGVLFITIGLFVICFVAINKIKQVIPHSNGIISRYSGLIALLIFLYWANSIESADQRKGGGGILTITMGCAFVILWGVKILRQLIICLDPEVTKEKTKQGWLSVNIFAGFVGFLIYQNLRSAQQTTNDYTDVAILLLITTLSFDFSNIVTAQARWSPKENSPKPTRIGFVLAFSIMGAIVYYAIKITR